MNKAVIDTNIIISGIIWPSSYPAAVLKLFRQNKIVVVLSKELFTEIQDNLTAIGIKYNFNQRLIIEWLELLKKYAFWTADLPIDITVCRDPDDNMVLATAIAGKTDYIITGDKDLLALKKYKQIRILSAKNFVKALK